MGPSGPWVAGPGKGLIVGAGKEKRLMTRLRYVGLVVVVLLSGWMIRPAIGQDLNTLLVYFIQDLRNGTFSIGTGKDIVLSSSNGSVTVTGNGDGADEALTLDLNSVTNGVLISSPTVVTSIGFTDNSMDVGSDTARRLRDLYLAGFVHINRKVTVTVDGATTFGVTSSYTVLACTGAETINTITAYAAVGTLLWIEHSDTDCTIADDDSPTAANAIDLTGTATNDVGAVAKVIGLISNGTSWLQMFESDN